MQKVEALVRNSRDDREDRFARRKHDRKWSQGISEGANTIRPDAETGSDLRQARRVARDWRSPRVPDDAGEGEDGEIGQQDQQDHDLEASSSAEDQVKRVGQQIGAPGRDTSADPPRPC